MKKDNHHRRRGVAGQVSKHDERHVDNPAPAEVVKTPPPAPSADLAMLRWTSVVAIFTAVLAIVGGLQFWAFVQSERAVLSIEGISALLPKLGDKSLHLTIQVRNSGRSTARAEAAAINVRFGSLPEEPDYRAASKIAVPPITSGGVTRTDADIPFPFAVPPNDAKGLADGSIQMTVFGYVRYYDDFSGLFGKTTFGFCYYYQTLGTQTLWTNCLEPAYTY